MLLSLAVSLIVAFAISQLAVLSTTIFLHRAASHRAVVLHPAVAVLCRLPLWLSTGIIAREWVAVHRKHHAFMDQEGDPHSPYLEGFWSVQLGNVFHYIREARKTEVLQKYAADIRDDFWDRWLFNYGKVGLGLGIAILCSVLGLWWGLLAAGVHAVTYVFVLSSSINGLCHHVGYRNFGNTATNLRLLALITGGEGLHNNHHRFPRSPKFSVRRSEIDPAWPILKLLTSLKLAEPSPTISRASLPPV